MSTNDPAVQAIYQRKHRSKKRVEGLCVENGCQTATDGYRCAQCRRLHTDREVARRRRMGKINR